MGIVENQVKELFGYENVSYFRNDENEVSFEVANTVRLEKLENLKYLFQTKVDIFICADGN